MINKKRKTTKVKFIATCLVSIMALTFLSGCGSKNAEGSATIGVDLTAANSSLHPQISSMLLAETKDTINIEGESYTLKKEFYSGSEESEGATDGSQSGNFEVSYTFTGEVTSSDGNKYVLAPPTNCQYDISWGTINTLGEGFAPTVDGKGTEKDDSSSLNWFYGPYVVDSKDNTKPMTVYIEDGKLSFEGFEITEEE